MSNLEREEKYSNSRSSPEASASSTSTSLPSSSTTTAPSASEEAPNTTILDYDNKRLNLTLGQTDLTFKKWKKLECAICHHLPKDATMLNNEEKNPCQHTFCFSCIKHLFRRDDDDDTDVDEHRSVRCPTCRHLTKEVHLIPNSSIRRHVLNIRARCVNTTTTITGATVVEGCQWHQSIGKNGEKYEAHVKECKFTGAPCEKCKVFVWHEKLQQHLINECTERTITCAAIDNHTDGCGQEIKLSGTCSMIEHLAKCEKRHDYCAFNRYLVISADVGRCGPFNVLGTEDCKSKKFSKEGMILHDVAHREQHNHIVSLLKVEEEKQAAQSQQIATNFSECRSLLAASREKFALKERELKELDETYSKFVGWSRKRALNYSYRHHLLVDPRKIGCWKGEYRSPKFFAHGKEWRIELSWLSSTTDTNQRVTSKGLVMGTAGLAAFIYLCSGPYPCGVDYSLALVSKSGHSVSLVSPSVSDDGSVWRPENDKDSHQADFIRDAGDFSDFDPSEPFTLAVVINSTDHDPRNEDQGFFKKRPCPARVPRLSSNLPVAD